MRTDPIVQRHLTGIANTLRGEVPPSDPTLAARRAAVLDNLTDYALKGQFPTNNVGIRQPKRPVEGGFAQAYENRAPLFVDDAGVHCAVGHLVAASNPALVAKVRAVCNEAWIEEMPVPELAEWAAENGLTMRDVARIQPSYSSELVEDCAEEVSYTADRGVSDEYADQIFVTTRYEYAAACFDTCRGPFLLWFAVDNQGGVDATDVHVQGWLPNGDVAVDETIPLAAGTSALFGPFTFPHDEAINAYVSVVVDAPGDTNPENGPVSIFGPQGQMGLGIHSECENPDESGGGCSHGPASGVAGVAIVGGILGLRRRRAAGGPGDRWAAR